MTLPRPVYPNSYLMITRKTTQGQFLLRPDAETNNTFVYCLGVAALRHKVDVINFVQMSNHLHDGVYDREGNAPAFYEYFHKLLAKCINVIRGRSENVFSSDPVCVVRLEDVVDIIDKMAYIALNPVKAGLVERVSDWPGAYGYDALMSGKPLKAYRPAFFSKDGSMPAEVTLTLTIPPELGDRDEFLAKLKARVEELERKYAEERAAKKLRVLGATAVTKQDWHARPRTGKPRRGLRPTIAAKNFWVRLEALRRDRAFIEAYRTARKFLTSKTPKPFPVGTYWLRRFVSVDIEPAENLN